MNKPDKAAETEAFFPVCIYKPGDIVELKSGSWPMVFIGVEIVEEDTLAVVTFAPPAGSEVITQTVPLVALTHAT